MDGAYRRYGFGCAFEMFQSVTNGKNKYKQINKWIIINKIITITMRTTLWFRISIPFCCNKTQPGNIRESAWIARLYRPAGVASRRKYAAATITIGAPAAVFSLLYGQRLYQINPRQCAPSHPCMRPAADDGLFLFIFSFFFFLRYYQPRLHDYKLGINFFFLLLVEISCTEWQKKHEQ